MPTNAKPAAKSAGKSAARPAAPPQRGPSTSRIHRLIAYVVLALGYVIAIFATVAGIAGGTVISAGTYLLFLMLVAVLYVDASGFFTLRGLLSYAGKPAAVRVVIGIVLVILSPVLLAVYFARALRNP